MRSSSVNEIEQRLARLERAASRSRRVAVGVMLIAVVVCAMGQRAASDRVVKAERFELVDKRGLPQATWSLGNDANALAFLDKAGKVRAMFGVTSDGLPGLTLYDKSGAPRLYAYVGNDDSAPALKLLGQDNKVPVALSLDDNGAGYLNVRRSRGDGQIILAFLTEQPRVLLRDAQDKEVARLPQD
jgi:hypothetical protein